MTNDSKFEIREIALGEHAACAIIHINAWNGVFSDFPRKIDLADFERETEGERILVGLLNGEIVAYASIWEPDWFIHHLYVDPLAQRVGLGRALMLHVEELAEQESISLKCQLANTAAIAFYRSLGFSDSGDEGVDEYGSWIGLVKNQA